MARVRRPSCRDDGAPCFRSSLPSYLDPCSSCPCSRRPSCPVLPRTLQDRRAAGQSNSKECRAGDGTRGFFAPCHVGHWRKYLTSAATPSTRRTSSSSPTSPIPPIIQLIPCMSIEQLIPSVSVEAAWP